MVLQVEGFKQQLDQVPWTDADVPGAVGTVGVDGGMAGTRDCARRAGQSITTAWQVTEESMWLKVLGHQDEENSLQPQQGDSFLL